MIFQIGDFQFSLTTIENYKLCSTDSYRLNFMLIFYSLCWSLIWSLSCLIVGSFLESFNETTGRDFLFCITAYKKLSGALACFFFVFLSLTQFLIVVDTFLSFSKGKVSINLQKQINGPLRIDYTHTHTHTT